MPIYEFAQTGIKLLPDVTFGSAGLHERRDLQRLLRENIEVIASDALVISEEFGDWEDSRRRIDLLAIDKDANLVVIELKRTEDGGHMELQAIRYAAMVSTMTFDKAADIFEQYLGGIGKENQSARSILLDFLDWDEPDVDAFAPDVRIILASAEFSKELTSSVLWLINHDIDIKCVRLKPYTLDGRVLVDVQQIIPPPEAAEYQVKIREKIRKERQARTSGADFTRFDIQFDGERHLNMWKRNAVFLICKGLCNRGVKTDEIFNLFTWRPTKVWYSVDGVLNASEFEEQAATKALAAGQNYNARRWFGDDGELVHEGARTYAFSNQWGGPNWHKAMNILKDKYPQFKIEFSATA